MGIYETKIFTDVATNLIEDVIKGAWSKVKKIFVDLENELDLEYGIAYEKYLQNTMNKYSRIKTIIYRRVPQDLYSFYECVGVECDDEIIDTNNASNIFEKYSKVIITGTGGIGKSILLKHIFLNSIQTTNFIPVFIELRSFNSYELKDISLKNILYKALTDNGFNIEIKYFENSLEKGGYTILLDGFDEVNRELSNKVSSEIKSFSDKYKNNNFIVSSRPSEEFIGWNDFVEMSALPLTKKQALSLIEKLDFDKTVKEIFYKELNDNLYDEYESFASNPLLLNIMLLTFNNHASIPDKLNDFYEQAFSTLYNMHDATKDSYVRDIRTKLGCEDFKLIFSYLCFKSYFNDEYEFSEHQLRKYISKAIEKYPSIKFNIDDYIEDLTQSVCMLVKEGLIYRFSHRSFQEYFAALYTCKLTDDIQSKLLISWIKESNVFTDSYFSMLFNMQGEKVNKIILSPGIKELMSLYENKGFSIAFLKELFEYAKISRRIGKDGKSNYSLSLFIKNEYICSVLRLTCNLNRYSYNTTGKDDENYIIEKIIKSKGYHSNVEFTFDELSDIISEEELLCALDWLKRQVEFTISIYNNCNMMNIKNKRKVSSILEEL